MSAAGVPAHPTAAIMGHVPVKTRTPPRSSVSTPSAASPPEEALARTARSHLVARIRVGWPSTPVEMISCSEPSGAMDAPPSAVSSGVTIVTGLPESRRASHGGAVPKVQRTNGSRPPLMRRIAKRSPAIEKETMTREDARARLESRGDLEDLVYVVVRVNDGNDPPVWHPPTDAFGVDEHGAVGLQDRHLRSHALVACQRLGVDLREVGRLVRPRVWSGEGKNEPRAIAELSEWGHTVHVSIKVPAPKERDDDVASDVATDDAGREAQVHGRDRVRERLDNERFEFLVGPIHDAPVLMQRLDVQLAPEHAIHVSGFGREWQIGKLMDDLGHGARDNADLASRSLARARAQ